MGISSGVGRKCGKLVSGQVAELDNSITQHLLDVQDRGARAVLRWCVTGTRRWAGLGAGQPLTSPGMFRLSPVLALGFVLQTLD